MQYPHPLVRLTVAAIALLIVGGCTQGQHNNRPAPRGTVYPTNQTASFKVNPGTQDESPYTVVFQRGQTIDANRNAISGTGTGVRLGSACRLQANDKAIPFTLRVRWDKKTPVKEVDISLHSYAPRTDGKEGSLNPKTVQIELARPGEMPRCDVETSVASTSISYQKSFTPDASMFSGWLILRGQGQSTTASLAITSTAPYNHGNIANIRGLEPYKRDNSQKAIVSGGSTLFRASVSV